MMKSNHKLDYKIMLINSLLFLEIGCIDNHISFLIQRVSHCKIMAEENRQRSWRIDY